MKIFVVLAFVAMIGSAYLQAIPADVKARLISRGNDLVKQAEDAATKLEDDKKTHEATIIKTEEAHLKKLIEDLTAATEQRQVTQLERQLGLAEARLAHELARVGRGPVTPPKTNPDDPPKTPTDPVDPPSNPSKRDAKDDLITKGNDLVKKAEDAITKLTADKKTHEATVIKTEEAHIKKLIEDLTAATDDAKVKGLERQLTLLETRLDHELARVNAGPSNPPKTPVDPPKTPVDPPTNPAKRDAKSDLIDKANALVKQAEDAVTKLTADKKTHEATLVKTESAHITKLIADLTAATEQAAITRLEHQLSMADMRLQHELSRVNPGTGPVVDPPKTPVDPPTNPGN